MENNTLISNELEAMRQQIGLLRDKLEKQTIVNEMHIRRSMKTKRSEMTRVVAGSIFGGVFALVYCPWFFYTQELSVAFIVFTAVMLAVCLVLTIRQQYILKSLDFSQGNLVETAAVLSKVRKHYKEWYKVAIPLIIFWFGWLMYEMISTLGTDAKVIGFCAGAVIGGLIGGFVGFRMNRKVVDKANEILDQIEELQKGE